MTRFCFRVKATRDSLCFRRKATVPEIVVDYRLLVAASWRGGYRAHLKTTVASSAAPYGYTLTIWTAGAGHLLMSTGFRRPGKRSCS